MPNAADIKPESRFIALFIGRSGSGKSDAAYSFVGEDEEEDQDKKLFVFDVDGRIRGGISRLNEKQRRRLDYEYFPPPPASANPQQMTAQLAFYEKLNKQCDNFLVMQNMRTFNYTTMVFDSITWAAINLLSDAVPLTHSGSGSDGEKGKFIGKMMMAGPQDYGFQSTGIFNMLKFLKTMPVNIIVTAHIVPKWGKPPGGEKFAANVVVGEQLALTDKLAESIPSSFDHIVYFTKYDTGNDLRFTASFHGELARTAFSQLPYGEMDITGVSFYKKMMGIVKRGGVR